MFYFQTLYFRILLRCQSRFFSIGTITSYNGTLTNTVEWICCMFPVTTYGGRILSFTISIQHFFSLFFIVPCCFSSPHTYPFQRVSDTNTSKKPDTLVVTHLFFHVKQKKTCIKLVFLKVLSSIWYLERHFRSVKETLVILTQLAKFRKSSNINKKYSEFKTSRGHIV